jgi:hypothetical protein
VLVLNEERRRWGPRPRPNHQAAQRRGRPNERLQNARNDIKVPVVLFEIPKVADIRRGALDQDPPHVEASRGAAVAHGRLFHAGVAPEHAGDRRHAQHVQQGPAPSALGVVAFAKHRM